MRELLGNVALAMKRIFKCAKANFLFTDKDTIELLTIEGAQFRQMSHCHETFQVYIPDGTRAD